MVAGTVGVEVHLNVSSPGVGMRRWIWTGSMSHYGGATPPPPCARSLARPPATSSSILRAPQGKHLALLPVEPQIGKALVFGCLLGCLDPVLTIAALLSQRNPFVMPMNKKEQADLAKRRFAQVRGWTRGGRTA